MCYHKQTDICHSDRSNSSETKLPSHTCILNTLSSNKPEKICSFHYEYNQSTYVITNLSNIPFIVQYVNFVYYNNVSRTASKIIVFTNIRLYYDHFHYFHLFHLLHCLFPIILLVKAMSHCEQFRLSPAILFIS